MAREVRENASSFSIIVAVIVIVINHSINCHSARQPALNAILHDITPLEGDRSSREAGEGLEAAISGCHIGSTALCAR